MPPHRRDNSPLILRALLSHIVLVLFLGTAAASDLPRIEGAGKRARLIVDGKPFLMLAGELRNSTSSDLASCRRVWPLMQALNLNTVLATVSWELMEPQEGRFDFTLVDGLIDAARAHHLKLVLIWFGSWKNGASRYAPAWVKCDTVRFPRCQDRSGMNSETLSPFSTETCAADGRAFAALMTRIREVDTDHTVLMMQVQNEPGAFTSRDFHPLAEAAYNKPVPEGFMGHIQRDREQLHPQLRDLWIKHGEAKAGNWPAVFGRSVFGDEIFQAWHMASYIERVAAVGKRIHPLPMFVNAWLPQAQPNNLPGKYPSGGPVPAVLDIYEAAAPSIDFRSPDIYAEDYRFWTSAYSRRLNALFVPEARRDPAAGARAFYTFGEHHALGFSPFAIDDLAPDDPLRDHYKVLRDCTPLILEHAGRDTMRGFLQFRQASETLDLGDLRISIGFPGAGQKPIGGGLIVRTGPEAVVVAGVRCTLDITGAGNHSLGTDKAEILNADGHAQLSKGILSIGDTPQLVRLHLGTSRDPVAPATQNTTQDAARPAQNGTLEALFELAKNPDAPGPVNESTAFAALRTTLKQNGVKNLVTFRQSSGQNHAEVDLGVCRLSVQFTGSAEHPGGGLVVRLGEDAFLTVGLGFTLQVVPRPDGLGPVQIQSIDSLQVEEGLFRKQQRIDASTGAVVLKDSLDAFSFSTATPGFKTPSRPEQEKMVSFLKTLAGNANAPLPQSLQDAAFTSFRAFVAALRPILEKVDPKNRIVAEFTAQSGTPFCAMLGTMEVEVTPSRGARWQQSGALVAALAPDTFLVVGAGITTSFRQVEPKGLVTDTLALDEMNPVDGRLEQGRRINGDELSIQLKNGFGALRVITYTYPKRDTRSGPKRE